MKLFVENGEGQREFSLCPFVYPHLIGFPFFGDRVRYKESLTL